MNCEDLRFFLEKIIDTDYLLEYLEIYYRVYFVECWITDLIKFW